MRALAHLSDLHLGQSAKTDAAAVLLSRTLQKLHVDHVVVTGDITHRGREAEVLRFYKIFEPFLLTNRLTVVPGNHDRNGPGAGMVLMRDLVSVETPPGLRLVRVNSTAPHNRSIIEAHGDMTEAMVDQIDFLLPERDDRLQVILLHHHVLPLPVEGFGEWFAQAVGWPNAQELRLGQELLRRVSGRCDLILHGHKHIPMDRVYQDAASPKSIHVYNAGSSTELRRFRLFHHEGGVIEKVAWIDATTG